MVPIQITTIDAGGSTVTSQSLSTSSFTTVLTQPTIKNIEASALSSNHKNTIIAGAVGGAVGLVLFALVGAFLFVRWRRSKRGQPVDWESVRGSMLFRSGRNSSSASVPRTPRSARSQRTTLGSPRTPEMAYAQAQYASAMPAAATTPTTGTRPDVSVSPRLVIHSPTGARSLESTMGGSMLDDVHEDPFADPAAIARVRPAHRSTTPTIRESATTLVDVSGGEGGSLFKQGQLGVVNESEDVTHVVDDPFLDPPPALFKSPMGQINRLSSVSSQLQPPSPTSETASLRGLAL